jgi:RES domain-containing protein
MLYAAQHLSLACIEILVHLDKSQLPRGYVWSKTDLHETPALLGFEGVGDVVSCQAVGHSWVSAVNQLAVQVPSVIIPEEFNILLNPRHTGMGVSYGAILGAFGSIRACSSPNRRPSRRRAAVLLLIN